MNKYIQYLATLTIFLIFSLGSLGLMILGANQYIEINQEMQTHFEIRTPFSYITNKVRQNDIYGSISVQKIGDKDILVLAESDGESIYETWIYEYEGSLRELYIEQGQTPELNWGTELMGIEKLEIEMKNNSLEISFITPGGHEESFIIGIRTGGSI